MTTHAIHAQGKRCVIVIALMLGAGCAAEEEPFLPGFDTFDALISNAVIIDGLGNEPRTGDVLIDDGTIVFVGNSGLSADEIDTRVGRFSSTRSRYVRQDHRAFCQ